MTEPTPQFEPLTPVEVERQIRWVQNKMTRAQADLREARDEEIAAKHAYEREHRRALLSSDCPKVSRGGYTTAERDAWVDEQCAGPREAYELAEVKRKTAEEHLRTLYQQGTLAATLAKSVHQAYSVARTGERQAAAHRRPAVRPHHPAGRLVEDGHRPLHALQRGRRA